MEQKLYAVKIGRKPGVYKTWEQAAKQVKNYSGSEYRVFESFQKSAAMKYVQGYSIDPNKECFAIKRGRFIGIFNSLKKVKKYTDGFSNFEYKKCQNQKEALEYLGIKSGQDFAKLELNLLFELDKYNGIDCYFVDGSRTLSFNKYSYGLCLVKNGEIVLEKNGSTSMDGEIPDYAGELWAAIEAVKQGIKNKARKVYLFHDSFKISNLILDNQKRSNCPLKTEYIEFIKMAQQEIEIEFIKVRAHAANPFNNRVDQLAKEAN